MRALNKLPPNAQDVCTYFSMYSFDHSAISFPSNSFIQIREYGSCLLWVLLGEDDRGQERGRALFRECPLSVL